MTPEEYKILFGDSSDADGSVQDQVLASAPSGPAQRVASADDHPPSSSTVQPTPPRTAPSESRLSKAAMGVTALVAFVLVGGSLSSLSGPRDVKPIREVTIEDIRGKCLSSDAFPNFELVTDLDCERAVRAGQALAVEMGVATSVGAGSEIQLFVACDSIQSDTPTTALANTYAYMAALVESNICRGDLTNVTLVAN